MYNSHFPPLPLLHNAKQALVTKQSESDEDLELKNTVIKKHKNLYMNGNLSTNQRKGKEN